MTKSAGNKKKRRIAALGVVPQEELNRVLEQVRYGGSANHKKHPGDYGFKPPVNPRASKSLCDGLRTVLKGEAQALLISGIKCGMVSEFPSDGLPKYVWCVDEKGEPYEAKLGEDGRTYHGYRLSNASDPSMRNEVLSEWRKRT